LAILLAGLLCGAGATTSATGPAPRQDRSQQQIQTWLVGLSNVDPGVRAQSLSRLLGLHRDDLDALRRAVGQSRSIAPSQAIALRSIVTHVYLSGEPYAANRAAGFMGVHFEEIDITDDVPISRPDELGRVYGVLVTQRLAGFGGYAPLMDGDIITELLERPGLIRQQGPEGFAEAVREFAAGQTLHVRVLRQGQQLEVPVMLSARPRAADTADELDDLLQAREQAAGVYWDRSFAPLLRAGHVWDAGDRALDARR
jgi:hypothetical protein